MELKFLLDKVVELVGGGSIVNGATPSNFHKHDRANWIHLNLKVRGDKNYFGRPCVLLGP